MCEDKILSKFKIEKKIEKIKHKFDIIVFLVGHKKNKPLHDYFRKQKKI